MDLTPIFRAAFALVVFANVLVAGLEASPRDLEYVARRPALILRSILAIVVLVPMVAIALWRSLPIGPAAAIALGCAALAPTAPFFSREVERADGDRAYGASLSFLTCLIGVVTIPLGLAVFQYAGRLDPTIVPEVGEGALLLTLGLTVLLPLLVGVALRRRLPDVADRLVPALTRASSLVLPGLVGVVLLVGGNVLFHVGWATALVMVLLPLVALALGHALGGPAPEDRTALALATANRSPAFAGLVAATCFPDITATPIALAFPIVAALLSIPYVRARKRSAEERAAHEPVDARPAYAP